MSNLRSLIQRDHSPRRRHPILLRALAAILMVQLSGLGTTAWAVRAAYAADRSLPKQLEAAGRALGPELELLLMTARYWGTPEYSPMRSKFAAMKAHAAAGLGRLRDKTNALLRAQPGEIYAAATDPEQKMLAITYYFSLVTKYIEIESLRGGWISEDTLRRDFNLRVTVRLLGTLSGFHSIKGYQNVDLVRSVLSDPNSPMVVDLDSLGRRSLGEDDFVSLRISSRLLNRIQLGAKQQLASQRDFLPVTKYVVGLALQKEIVEMNQMRSSPAAAAAVPAISKSLADQTKEIGDYEAGVVEIAQAGREAPLRQTMARSYWAFNLPKYAENAVQYQPTPKERPLVDQTIESFKKHRTLFATRSLVEGAARATLPAGALLDQPIIDRLTIAMQVAEAVFTRRELIRAIDASPLPFGQMDEKTFRTLGAQALRRALGQAKFLAVYPKFAELAAFDQPQFAAVQKFFEDAIHAYVHNIPETEIQAWIDDALGKDRAAALVHQRENREDLIMDLIADAKTARRSIREAEYSVNPVTLYTALDDALTGMGIQTTTRSLFSTAINAPDRLTAERITLKLITDMRARAAAQTSVELKARVQKDADDLVRLGKMWGFIPRSGSRRNPSLGELGLTAEQKDMYRAVVRATALRRPILSLNLNGEMVYERLARMDSADQASEVIDLAVAELTRNANALLALITNTNDESKIVDFLLKSPIVKSMVSDSFPGFSDYYERLRDKYEENEKRSGILPQISEGLSKPLMTMFVMAIAAAATRMAVGAVMGKTAPAARAVGMAIKNVHAQNRLFGLIGIAVAGIDLYNLSGKASREHERTKAMQDYFYTGVTEEPLIDFFDLEQQRTMSAKASTEYEASKRMNIVLLGSSVLLGVAGRSVSYIRDIYPTRLFARIGVRPAAMQWSREFIGARAQAALDAIEARNLTPAQKFAQARKVVKAWHALVDIVDKQQNFIGRVQDGFRGEFATLKIKPTMHLPTIDDALVAIESNPRLTAAQVAEARRAHRALAEFIESEWASAGPGITARMIYGLKRVGAKVLGRPEPGAPIGSYVRTAMNTEYYGARGVRGEKWTAARAAEQPPKEKLNFVRGPKRNWYRVLGVKQDATQEEIKKQFRAWQRKLHSDVNPDPAARAKWDDIQAAYKVLGDPKVRKIYDNQRNVFNRFKR